MNSKNLKGKVTELEMKLSVFGRWPPGSGGLVLAVQVAVAAALADMAKHHEAAAAYCRTVVEKVSNNCY